MRNRIIAHLDMDAFFAAVEERDHEWLQGKPIVVGADPKDGKGRGVVSTANYKAREYGIRSALPITRAWQLSEAARKQGKDPAVFLQTDFTKYSEVSEAILAIVRRHASLVEQASIDEMYFDLTFTKSFKTAEHICHEIKKEIRKSERLTCTIGIAQNKLLAKIASDIKKPDGLTVVKSKESESFLEPMRVRKIPGIGPKTEKIFSHMGVETVRDLKHYPRARLQELLGKWGIDLYDRIRGIDDDPVTEAYETKSIGEQETFEKDTLDPRFIFARLEAMCRSIIDRFIADGFKSYNTVVITVRFADFETKSRSSTQKSAMRTFEELQRDTMRMILPFFDARENKTRKPIRLIGVRVEKLGL